MNNLDRWCCGILAFAKVVIRWLPVSDVIILLLYLALSSHGLWVVRLELQVFLC